MTYISPNIVILTIDNISLPRFSGISAGDGDIKKPTEGDGTEEPD